ncbi:MAG: hypothetical protein QNJ34_20335 [Xenococcaceae cyanobacterium MO_188.B29]|nr:hypothetical protein [Xenococcaceae cyanobacterium MO_188.B29]
MQMISDYEREKAIYLYVKALDNGDMDGVADVLELALCDSELARILEEIDLAYQEEEGILPIATDAAIVRDLIRQHLHSAFEEPDKNQSPSVMEFSSEAITKPITVGDVVQRLHQSKSLRKTECELVQSLLDCSIPIPSSPSQKAIKQLFVEDIKQNASPRFLDNFRKVAIKLGMGRSYNNAQLAAARQQKRNYKSTNK